MRAFTSTITASIIGLILVANMGSALSLETKGDDKVQFLQLAQTKSEEVVVPANAPAGY